MAASKSGKSYASRDALVRSLGFASYKEYLNSPLWSMIRSKVLASSKGRCVSCGGFASQVHHLHYNRSTLQGKSFEALKPLCGGCHTYAEFDDLGNKLSVKGMRKRWRGMMRRAKKAKVMMDYSVRLMDENAAHLRSII